MGVHRNKLIKFRIDLGSTSSKRNCIDLGSTFSTANYSWRKVMDYEISTITSKRYRAGTLNRFKVNQWGEYGPRFNAVYFASLNHHDIDALHTVLANMIKRSSKV